MRRKVLSGVKPHPGTHAGLWLDRYLDGYPGVAARDEEKGQAKWRLVEEVAELASAAGGDPPPEYRAFLNAYRDALAALGAEIRHGVTRGRVVVGLGEESVLETHIALHRTYGVPYIPGSALKGLASHFAATHLGGTAWARKLDPRDYFRAEAQQAVFGTTEEAGIICFYDALPVEWKLWPDVVTSHHPQYYGQKTAPPADWDSPNPVPFLSATGRFLFALGLAPGVRADEGRPWLETSWKLLRLALAEEGVGAKTSSGYGRILLEEVRPAQPITEKAPSDPTGELLRRFGRLKPTELAPQAPGIIEELHRLDAGAEEKRAAARVIWEKLRERGVLRGKEEKAWYRKLLDMLEGPPDRGRGLA